MIKYIAIPPTCLLESVEQSTHLVLAGRLQVSAEYYGYYRHRSEAGDFLILDNGAYEMGRSIGIDELIAWARRIQASEVVLPDILYSATGTIQLTHDALWRLTENPLPPEANIMIVPQGRTEGEWQWCLEQQWRACTAAGINRVTIGVAKHTTTWAPRSTGRLRLIRHAALYRTTIHLLGTDDGLLEVPLLPYTTEFVRSIDSSKPIVYAYYGQPLDTSAQPPTDGVYHRPKNYFNLRAQEFDFDLVRSNIEMMQATLRGKGDV